MDHSKKKKEICVCVAGSVDSGKSTTIGVLLSGELDDGNGAARQKVARHPHEIQSGKTSDISTKVVNYGENEITMVDLCGHEKYLKTTLYGLTGYFPDYGILIVAANRGLLKMTKEHLGILLYLKIPFIILITRADIAPKEIYDKTLSNLSQILKRFGKRIENINKVDIKEVQEGEQKDNMFNDFKLEPDKLKEKEKLYMANMERTVGEMVDNPNIVPVLSTSNKTGYCIDVLKYGLTHLKPQKKIGKVDPNSTVFYIDGKFTPEGIGLVVSGLTQGKTINLNSDLYLGPFNNEFKPIRVRSMHNNVREPVEKLDDNERGCLAIRSLDKKMDFGRSSIKKGSIIITKNLESQICYQFKATITVLNHSTMISPKYTPMIHCGIVRQTAKIILDEKTQLKMGDTAHVGFRFIQNPEFIEVGNIFFFREGTTKGVGTITEILSIKDDPDPKPAEVKRQRKYYKNKSQKKNPKAKE